MRIECNEVVVEIAAVGDDDSGGDGRPRAAPGEALHAPSDPADSAAAAVTSGV